MTDKITFFNTNMHSGGISRVIVNLARGLTVRDYDIDLVLLEESGEMLDMLPEDVRVTELATPQVWSDQNSTLGLIRYLDETAPDTVIAFNVYPHIISMSAKQLLGDIETAFVLYVPTMLSQSLPGSYFLENYWMAPDLLSRLYPLADRIIAISEDVARDLETNYNCEEAPITVIHNPTDVGEIDKLKRRPVDHRWLSPKEHPVLLAVGRLDRAKRFEDAIRALDVALERTEMKLIVLGDGRRREQLRELASRLDISEHVSMPGHVDNPYTYMYNSDVMALPSQWEGFGNVLVEALACGTPVVATNCPGGPSEILDGGTYGPLVPVGDYEALGTQICRLLEDPPSSELLVSRAMDFSLKQIVDQYDELLARLC